MSHAARSILSSISPPNDAYDFCIVTRIARRSMRAFPCIFTRPKARFNERAIFTMRSQTRCGGLERGHQEIMLQRISNNVQSKGNRLNMKAEVHFRALLRDFQIGDVLLSSRPDFDGHGR